MGIVLAPVRRRMLVGALVAGIALALIGPATAFAAMASFSSRAPASGAVLTSTRPTFSITAYDRYGIRGTGAYSMTIDGKVVKPTAKYLVTGSWNPLRPDYRRIRLSYRPSTNLAAGSHTVLVKIRDLRRYSSSTSWKFTVAGAAPVETTPTVTFSSHTPTPKTSSSDARPVISLAVYESFGVKGTGSYTMTLDGAAVVPSISYTTSGDYRRFTLGYRAPTALSAGVHTVNIGLRDIQGKQSSTSWQFAIPTTETGLEEMPSPDMSLCATCHTSYPAAHPMAACESCHAADAPLRPSTSEMNPGGQMNSLTSANTSAHTLSCALEACHGGGGDFPHVLDNECSRCHNGAYANVPAAHSTSVEELHTSTSTGCVAAGCHVASLTTEHYRRYIDGVRLSCETCHASSDPEVRDAISSHSTDCGSCHSFTGGVHPVEGTLHTSSASCVAGACHPSNVSVTHGDKCAACHAVDKFPSTVCSDCHSAGTFHDAIGGKHLAPSGGCVTAGCHLPDMTVVHADANGLACQACHAVGKTPSLQCGTCHTGSVASVHGTIAKHAASPGTCVAASCHVSDVATTHVKDGISHCEACHGPGKSPTTTCTNCHTGSVASVHGTVDAHNAPAGTCVSVGCHTTDVSAIHVKNSISHCEACHGAGKTPSIECSSCHVGDISTLHVISPEKHTSPDNTCVTAGCHVTSVYSIHVRDGVTRCDACHGAGKTLTLVCTTVGCHPGSAETVHLPIVGTRHDAAEGTCVTSGCHVSDVSKTHVRDSIPRCGACHSTGTTPTLACANCHAGDVSAIHTPVIGTRHAAPQSTCVTDDCHVSDVAVLHVKDSIRHCEACHGEGKTPTLLCATAGCHAADTKAVHEPVVGTRHDAPAGSCVGAGCHITDVTSIHVRDSVRHCEACHAAGKTPTLLCATIGCHPGDAETVHAVVINGRHTAPLSTCVTSGCHGDDVALTHVKDSVSKCVACHGVGKTPSLTCANAGCHPGEVGTVHGSLEATHSAPVSDCVNSTCHDVDVTYLHSKSTRSCGACHAEGITPTLTCQSAACHPGDIATLHIDMPNAHVAPISTCVSDKCHPQTVTDIHASGLRCAACHARGVTPSLTCANCHTTGLVEKHPTATSPHTSPAVSCVAAACHDANIAIVHEASQSSCAACHAPGVTPQSVCSYCHQTDYAGLHVRGAAKHTAPLGLCVRTGCHVSNVSAIHEDSLKNCNACHGRGITPSISCSPCHVADTRAVHTNYTTVHTSPVSGCTVTGCHTLSVTRTHSGVFNSCAICHTGVGTPSKDCAGCHDGFPPTHPAPPTAHTSTYVGCVISGCHASDVAVLHNPSTQKCAACHAVGKTPSLNCVTCHTGDIGTLRHPQAAAKHGVPLVNCVGTGCHGASVATIHIKGGAPMCQRCHANGVDVKVKGVDCANCHAGGGDHVAAHNSCNGCHGGDHWGGPYVGTSDCTSCHDKGGSYTHPGTSCHGCDDPGGYTWTGIW